MCLLQCSCLKGQCSSNRDGQVSRPGKQAAGEIDGDSDSDSEEDEVQVQWVHAIMPPVPPIAPSPGASDDSSGSADEVELHRYPAVPTVPAVAPALLSAATPAGLAGRGAPAGGHRQWGTGSGVAGASYAERTSALRECSCESASARGWGHSRRACTQLEGPRAGAGLSAHGTKPAGQRNLAWLGGQCQRQDAGCQGTSRAANAACGNQCG
jgi:hypothetical protein